MAPKGANVTLVALVILGVVALAAIGAYVYGQRDNRFERAELLDRIQAPEAVHLAAVERAIGQREAVPVSDPYDEIVVASPDVALDQLLSGG